MKLRTGDELVVYNNDPKLSYFDILLLDNLTKRQGKN
jgi:hypothetical protein